jgi:cob(I)alamin adenosyltransferase
VPRITKVYTRAGDDGHTALGSGRRVSKSCARIAAYGTVDELNAVVGVVLASGVAEDLVEPLKAMQNALFHAGAELCVPEEDRAKHPGPRIEARHVEQLERLMDTLCADLPALKNFVLPGGTPAAAQLQVARTVCRRAERLVVALAESEPVSPELIQYLNRLSDALFVMARRDNQAAGVPEPLWDSRA